MGRKARHSAEYVRSFEKGLDFFVFFGMLVVKGMVSHREKQNYCRSFMRPYCGRSYRMRKYRRKRKTAEQQYGAGRWYIG